MPSKKNKRAHNSDSDDSNSDKPPPKTLVTSKLDNNNHTKDNTMVNTNTRIVNGVNGAMTDDGPNIMMTPVVVLNRDSVQNAIKRRSLGLSFHESTPSVDPNEELEKRRRGHHRIAAQRRSCHSPAVATPSRKSFGPSAMPMNPTQLKEHYAVCIKLSASNKINTKNAFGLHLIDYMSDLIKGSHDGQMNFKLASSALDAGAKIYSHRVDCVHAEAQKVASGLVMALDSKAEKGAENGLFDQNDNENEDNDDDAEPKPKRKKVTKRNVITVVQNVESLNINKIESNLEIDPVFHHLSSAFDMGNVNGLLMVNLKVNTNGMLMLDSNSHFDVTDDNTVNDNCSMQSISELYKDIDEISKANDLICPKLSTFEFHNREEVINMSFRDESPERRMSFTFDLNAEVEDVDDMAFDGGNDNFDDGDDNGSNDERIPETAHKSLIRAINMTAVKDLANILSDKPSDYSYFNQKIFGNTWAGPNHWKRCPFQREKKFIEGETKQRKQRKQYSEIDFLIMEISEDDDKTGDSDLKLKVPTLQKWSSNHSDLQLPEDHGFDPKNLAKSFNKSEEIFKCAKSQEILESSLPNNNHDESFDDRPQSPDMGNDRFDFDDDMDPISGGFPPFADDGTIGQSEPFATGTQQSDPFAFIGDNLIEQPYDIDQINLPYAKFAKKMDVKRLKRAMWNVLTSDPNEDNNDLHLPVQTPARKMNTSLHFSDLYQTLPKFKIRGIPQITSLMASNLSAPIAFVTLLHLCNEMGLQLKGQKDLEDFDIEKPIDHD